MSTMKILFCLVFVITIFNINSVKGFVCEPDICSRVRCKGVAECGPNQILKPGGYCNCCNECFTILGENETCGSPLQGVLLGAPPPTAECDTGLICDNGICQKIKV